MYGDGNTARLTEDVTKSFKQTIDGLSDSLGVDLNNVVSGFIGSKTNGDASKQIEKTESDEGSDDTTSFKEVESDDDNK
jgi:flotillin